MHPLGSVFRHFTTLSLNMFFPDSQSKHSLVQLEAVCSCLTTCYLGKQSDPHLIAASSQ